MGLDSNTQDLFVCSVTRPEEEIDLLEAALLLAADEYPGLPVEEYGAHMEELAAALRWEIADGMSPEHKIYRLNRFLFSELGFEGNQRDYYDPRNSFLNEVLDRRLGSPAALSLVAIELGRRIGLPIQGIRMPLHFMVAYWDEDRRIYIDPFRRGRILRFEDCAELVLKLSRGRVQLNATHLAKAGPKEILVRTLNNLKRAYSRSRDYERCLWAIDRVLVLRPGSPCDVRDRGVVLTHLGEFEQARLDLEFYLRHEPDAPDADMIRKQIRQVIRRTQEMN